MRKSYFLTSFVLLMLIDHLLSEPVNGTESAESLAENEKAAQKRMVEFVDGQPVVRMHGSIMDSMGSDGIAEDGENG